MANMFDTECKEVMDTSDGDDHQLQDNGSRQLMRTEIANDYSANAALFRRLMQINDARKPSRSTSDRSEVEILADFEFCPTPKLWQGIEERENGRDRYEPKTYNGRSSVSPQFGENENERNGEASNSPVLRMVNNGTKFDQDITDTLRIADAYVDDKRMALQAASDKEKSLREECEKIVKENHMLMCIQSENVAIQREVTKKLDNELQSMIVNHNELDHQLRESKLQNRMDREEFEKLLKATNQCSYSNPKDDEMAITS